MKKIVFQYLLFTICCYYPAFGQTELYLKEVKWEKYKDSYAGVSFLSPKLPVVINLSDSCRQLESKTYYSYAGGAVYSVVVNSKSKKPIPKDCYSSSEFGKWYFEEKIKSLTANASNIVVNEIKLKDKSAVKFTKAETSYWLINDLSNNRWVEVAVTSRPDTITETEKLLNSIEFNNNSQAIEINEGAERMFGDFVYDPAADGKDGGSKKSENAAISQNDGIVIVHKPRANYTDAARQAHIQGSVMLRVVFLASGGIGNITSVTELPYGMTEEAVKAAKKISFLPGRKKQNSCYSDKAGSI